MQLFQYNEIKYWYMLTVSFKKVSQIPGFELETVHIPIGYLKGNIS